MAIDRLTVETDDRLRCLDITDRVVSVLPGDADGSATVFAEHTTCGITVNEAEPRLSDDMATVLADLVPDAGWAHDELDDNADAHLRASLIGPGTTVPVEDGRLGLGTWQSVLLVECDGPRRRTVSVTTT